MERVAAIDENVVGFNITMGDATFMKVLQRAQQLVGHGLDIELLQVPMFTDQAAKVSTWNEFHDDVQVLFPVNMFDVLNNIWLYFVSERQVYVIQCLLTCCIFLMIFISLSTF